MAITKEQLISLGFKPSKRGGGLSPYRKYDTLIYPINDTDFLYIGYNQFNKSVNNKVIWKSFKGEDGRLTYPVISLGDTGYYELKAFIERALISVQNMATTTLTTAEINNKLVEESTEKGTYRYPRITNDEVTLATKDINDIETINPEY